jgi:hypothetical protein
MPSITKPSSRSTRAWASLTTPPKVPTSPGNTGRDGARLAITAIYEIESDDPQSVLRAIASASGTEAVPLTEALDKTGMVQLLVKAAETPD